jgi:glycerophosphoryl diester phosphodiesterase
MLDFGVRVWEEGMKAIDRDVPRVIAHRGLSARFPENTHAAFAAAIEAGADGVELDVQMTRDGVPVIFHDETLARVGMGATRIVDVVHEDLPESIPSLDEVMAIHGRLTRWMLEVKWYREPASHVRALMDRVLAIAGERPDTERSFILCFDLDLLRYGHERRPGLQYVWNQNTGRFADEPFLSGYSVRHQGLTAAIAGEVQAAGKKLFTFTCNEQEEIAHAAACGADGIMSDDIAFLRQTLSTGFQGVA